MEATVAAIGTFTMEKGGEFLFEKIKEYGQSAFKRKRLVKTIKKEISFLFDNNVNEDFFNNALFNLFDDNNIKKIVEKIVESNGYEFVDIFLSEIEKKLNESEIEYDAVKRISNLLVLNLIKYLKKKDPDFYNNYITNETYKKMLGIDNELKQLLDENRQIYELLKSPKYYNIYTYEKDLKNSTDPSIDLVFFEQQDCSLISYIETQIEKKENMLFWGLSKYEMLYTILWAFKKIGKDIYVFNSENEWEKFRASSNKENFKSEFVIPFFDTEAILNPISNRYNVFIKENGNYNNNDKAFRICRRNQDFIVEQMRKYTDDVQKAYDLIHNSTGFFYPLMESIFKNDTINKPYVVNALHTKAVYIAILINKWTDNSEDKQFIEKLYDGPYERFLDDIFPYLYDAKRDSSDYLNPIFIKKNNKYGYKDVVSVVSQNKTYKDLINKIPGSIWNNYYLNLEIIFSNELTISKEMTEGILNLLSMVMCYKSSNLENAPKISLIIKKYLDYVYDNEKWVSFADNVCAVAEISPQKTIEYLNKAIDNNQSSFLELFDSKSNNYQSYNKYCKYLFALEKLSVLEDYYLEAIDILFKLNDLSFEYTISNSPKQDLNYIFCPWINVSCLCDDSKIHLLAKNIKKYKRALEIAYDNLFYKNSCISSFSHLKYRKHKSINSDVAQNIVLNCYNQYLELVIKNCNNHEMLIDLVEYLKFYSISTLYKIRDDLLTHINQMEDLEKVSFKNKIRDLIYHCQFFRDWHISNDVILYFKDILSEIHFDVREYDYLYIFVDDFSFPVSDPIPFEDDNYFKINEEMAEKERLEKIEEFKSNGLSLEILLNIYKKSEIGYYIDMLSNEKSVTKKIDFLVYKCDNKRVIIVYLIALLRRNDKEYYEAIDYLKNNSQFDEEFISDALSIHAVDDKFLDYCNNLNENILSLLWIKRVNHYSNITISQIEQVLNCIMKYGNLSSYIEFLMDVSRYLTKEKIYEFMSKIDHEFILKDDVKTNNLDNYYLERLLSVVYPIAISKKDKIDLFAYLELRFVDVLEHSNLRFLNYVVSHDPKFYYDLVTNVYSKKYNSRISSLYFNLYFCPGYFDGTFDPVLFNSWMGKFSELMSGKKEEEMLPHVVGKLLAYCPNESESLPLMESVREYIENNYSDSLLSSFICAELNKRGIHFVTGGIEEMNFSNKYMSKALALKENGYFKCSYIYTAISEDYEYQSEYEAYIAKYE